MYRFIYITFQESTKKKNCKCDREDIFTGSRTAILIKVFLKNNETKKKKMRNPCGFFSLNFK